MGVSHVVSEQGWNYVSVSIIVVFTGSQRKMCILSCALDRLYNAKYFSSIDLKTSYWQIEVCKRDREKTDITSDGLFEFKVHSLLETEANYSVAEKNALPSSGCSKILPLSLGQALQS